jgi:Leucine-rich repeat (LRR) protein
MPLETLYLDSTPVSDLSPLAEMSQLHVLGCTAIPASDFSPLGRKPIETLNIQHTRVGDLSFLKGMPLKTLILNGCGLARGFQVLNEIKTLETLFLPALPLNLSQETMKEIDTLRQHPTLRQIERGVTMDGMDTRTAQSTEEFWKKWDADTRLAHAVWQAGVKTFEMRRLEDGTLYLGFWGRPLRDLGVLRGEPVSELGLDGTLVTDFTPLAEMPLRKLLVRETSVSDLSFLRASLCGSTIEELWLWRTKVADLSPIAQCAALKMLDLHSTPVMDLAPLRGLNLRELRLGSTRVSDLSPLVGMPLEKLYLEKTDVTDIAPLLTCPTLEYIVLPAGAQNVTALRALPNLQKISYQGKDSGPSLTADEFWANQEIESEKVQIWKYERLIADSLKLGRREKLMELVRESHADFLREDANAKPPLATTALTKRFKVSALALFLGDRTTYQAVCSELARDSRGTTDAYAASFAAKTLLLSPDSGVAPALVTQLMRVVKSGPGISNMNDFEPWGLLLKMFASYRSGDFPAAISAGALLAKHPTALPEAKTAGAAVMAMARQRQGDAIQAAVDLKVARESMLDGWEKEADRVWWWDWMIASVLIREAAQLVEGGSQSAK